MPTTKKELIYSQDPQFDQNVLNEHNSISNERIGFVVYECVEKFFSTKKENVISKRRCIF